MTTHQVKFAIIRQVAEFAQLDNSLEVRHLLAFLYIGLMNKTGALIPSLSQRLGIPLSSAARIVYRLGDKEMAQKSVGKPLGLVNTIVDPSDWRRRLYFLSSEGRELYQRITGEEPDMPSV